MYIHYKTQRFMLIFEVFYVQTRCLMIYDCANARKSEAENYALGRGILWHIAFHIVAH